MFIHSKKKKKPKKAKTKKKKKLKKTPFEGKKKKMINLCDP